MPDNIQEFNYNYWTSFTRRGCVGTIKNCFKDNKIIPRQENLRLAFFWQSFDRTDTGACAALQSLPFTSQQGYEKINLVRLDSGPVFANCKSLHYFACEAKGRSSDIVGETKLQVKL